jgi:hypothetical protein
MIQRPFANKEGVLVFFSPFKVLRVLVVNVCQKKTRRCRPLKIGEWPQENNTEKPKSAANDLSQVSCLISTSYFIAAKAQ